MQTIVLVVEGDQALAGLLQEVLESELACAVVWARDCRQALTLVQHEIRPHCVILDLTYPYAESFDFCAHLQNEPATAAVPVIVLADRAEDPSVLARRFAMVLPKPFDLPTLLTEVTPLLRPSAPPH